MDRQKNSNSVTMLELPSQVTDRKFLRMPLEDVVESDDEWNRCGKWILINRYEDMTWMDEAWKNLQILLEKGLLLMLKASTSAMKGEPGAISCYTRPGVEEIERAAKEIRKIVHYEGCMYYKMNKLTESGIDHRFGHKRIASYLYTFREFFYKSNNDEDWTLVNESNSESQRRNAFSVEMNFKSSQDIDFDQLPSKSRETDLKIDKGDKERSKMVLILWSSLDELENNLSEADRVWILGKTLIGENVIRAITCKKISNQAEIRLFIPKELNIESLVELCSKIRHEAQVFRFIRIRTTTDRHLMYTPENELYDNYMFVQK